MELRKFFKASSNEEVDSLTLNSTTDPFKADDFGLRDYNENEDRKQQKDIFTKEDVTETADDLENGFVKRVMHVDLENENSNAANFADLANPYSENDTKAGSVENLENCGEKQDCLGAVKLKSNVSRIPISEISNDELVKRELGLEIVPEACSVLGEDLLRKLVVGVACDCVVSVGDWDFPAHR